MPQLPLMRTFYDELFHLTLDLPQGWQVGITDEFPLLLVSPTDNGAPAVNLGIARSVLDPPSAAGFNALIAATKADQPNVYDNYQHIYDKNWLQDGYPAYLQRFHWHSTAPDDETQGIRFAQILAMVWAGADVLYDIHATTRTDLAEDNIPIIEHIIQSLVFYADMP